MVMIEKLQNWSAVENVFFKKVSRKFTVVVFASDPFLLHEISNDINC